MKARTILMAVVVAVLASTISAASVEWPKAVGGNGHFYEAVAVPGITWTEAQLAAEAKGGYLATITSPEENAFVFSVADDDAYWYVYGGQAVHGPWVGGVQPPGSAEPDGGWGWVTGEPFNYDNWSPESPNNGGVTTGPEDRIHFYAMGTSLDDRVPTWNDAVASDLHINSYVIEVTPEPATPPVADADGPYSVWVGDPLILNASGSTDSDGQIISYMWDLDNSGSFETDAGNQPFFVVDYEDVQGLGLAVGGMYDIHLQVTDNIGLTDTDSSSLRVIPEPATLSLLALGGLAMLRRRRRK